MDAEMEWGEAMARWVGADNLAEALFMKGLRMQPQSPVHMGCTTFPGPKKQFTIAGVPVVGMYNCLGLCGVPFFTCTGYDNKLFVSLNCTDTNAQESDTVKEVWSSKLAEALN